MKVGIYRNIPFEEYKKWDAFNYSSAKHILKSVRHWLYNKNNPTKKSQSMLLGSLVDTMLFEENSEYYRLPVSYTVNGCEKKFSMSAKACKEIYNTIANTGKIPVSASVYDTATEIVKSVKVHETAKSILSESETQLSMVWENPKTGILCKGRVDLISDNAITDLKTTTDASPHGFQYQLYKYGYHIQAAAYSEAIAVLQNDGVVLPYQFIAVENTPPHCCATYCLGPDSILCGKSLFEKSLGIYRDYLENKTVRGYSEFMEDIEIPSWVISASIERGEFDGYEG